MTIATSRLRLLALGAAAAFAAAPLSQASAATYIHHNVHAAHSHVIHGHVAHRHVAHRYAYRHGHGYVSGYGGYGYNPGAAAAAGVIGSILGAGVAGAYGYPNDCDYGSFGYCGDYGYDYGYGWPYYGGSYGYGYGPGYGYGGRYGNHGVGHASPAASATSAASAATWAASAGTWADLAATWAGLAAARVSAERRRAGNERSGPAFNSYRRAALRDASRKSDRKGNRHDYQRYLGHCARYGRPRFISSFRRLRGYARAGGA